MRRTALLFSVATAIITFAAGIAAGATVKLIGITGNQGLANDQTLYEINPATGAATSMVTLPFVPDTNSLGFNPQNGLLYRTGGSNAYSNSPTSNGFRDNQFMETISVLNGSNAQAAVFNANSEQFGLTAPRPTWVLPSTRRGDGDTDQSFRQVGPNEYHSVRDIAWSSTEHLFYGADEDGIYKLTPAGDSTHIGATLVDPNNPNSGREGGLKGISFFNVNNQRTLLASNKDGADLWTINPATGQKVGTPIIIKDPHTGNPINGVLSLEESPDGLTLYGITKGGSGATGRELITINPLTGASVSNGAFGVHMADLAFVYDTVPEPTSATIISIALAVPAILARRRCGRA